MAIPGSSKKALQRARRASLNSRAFRAGSFEAWKSLASRYHAYLSLAVGMPWQERLALANEARKRHRAARKMREAKEAAMRPYMESTREL